MRRLAIAAAVTVSAVVSMLPAVAGGQASVKPCEARWDKSAPVAGTTLHGRFSVACDAGHIAALDLSTQIVDTRQPQAAVTCDNSYAASNADQSCSGPVVKRGHVYALTYTFTAHGSSGDLSLGVCEDDSACDPILPGSDAHCARTQVDAYLALAQPSDEILTCAFAATAVASLR